MTTDLEMSALIISRPGRMRDSLRALLVSTSRFKRVDHSDDVSAALQRPAEVRPALALVDLELSSQDIRSALSQIQALWPQVRCLVLVEVGQEMIAQASGANGVLLKGFSTTQLFEMISDLLDEEKNGKHNAMNLSG